MSSMQWDDAALAELIDDPHGPVGHDLERRAIDGEAAAKRLLSQHGSGRIYRKYRPRRVHQASAPGEAPAVDLGLLRAAVGHSVSTDEDGLYGEWGIGAGDAAAAGEIREGGATLDDVGVYLELGTRQMAPRPFLRPSIPAAAGDSEV